MGRCSSVKAHTKRVVQVTAMDSNVNETDPCALPLIKFQLSYLEVKVISMQSSLCLAIAGTGHNGQGQTLKKLLVHIRSKFHPMESDSFSSEEIN